MDTGIWEDAPASKEPMLQAGLGKGTTMTAGGEDQAKVQKGNPQTERVPRRTPQPDQDMSQVRTEEGSSNVQ